MDLQRRQRANLAAVLQQEKFADLTFVVGPSKTVIRANRVFLASISQTFEQLLYPEDVSQNPSEVHFPDISASAFRAVLAFAYCNDPKITAENVLSLKYICERFGIDTLSEICSNFWMQTLTPENILSLLNQAILINSMGFIQECQECINKFAVDAETMLQSVGFPQMNLKTMIVFLQTENLKVSEHVLWDYCLKWADYQCLNEEPGAILNQSQSFQRELSFQQANSMNAQFSVEVEELVEETKGNDDEEEEPKEQATAEEDEAKKETEVADDGETNGKAKQEEEDEEENYDEDGNRVAGDKYIDEMAPEDADKEEAENAEEAEEAAEEDEPELMHIVITPAGPEEQVYPDDAKHAPWRMNVMQPKGRVDLLKCIKPYIRWGTMDGAYFVKKVIPEGIFDADELVTILKYYQCADEGCGEFVTESRWKMDAETEPAAPASVKKEKMDMKVVTVQRGEIIVHKWTYPGGKRMDAICMECSADTRLVAVGVFDCKGKCTVRARVYRGDNGDENEKNIIGESEQETFENSEASNTPQQLRFKEAVKIEKGERYTIELWQQNMQSDAVSYQIKKGKQAVMCRDKENGEMFQVSFSNAARSKNGTNEKKGAIPTLYFAVNPLA